jgi:hypothetical protein
MNLSQNRFFMPKKILLYAGYCKKGILDPLARAVFDSTSNSFLERNIETIAVFTSDHHFGPPKELLSSSSQRIFIRKNTGYDFGSWGLALDKINLEDYSHIIFMNDSIIGPLYSIAHLCAEIAGDESDYLGIVESAQIQDHYQSFLFSLSTRALKKLSIKDSFYKTVRMSEYDDEREQTIATKEIPLLSIVRKSNLSSRVIWPKGTLVQNSANPSLDGWMRLLGSGFGYVKKSVLYDPANKQSIQSVLSNTGYSLNLQIIKLLE